MTVLVDTSVLIDYLRGHPKAGRLLERERKLALLHASEITRLEILAGMRAVEEETTRALLSTLVWHPVDEVVSEEAGSLGRQWLPSHHTIDGADLAIAATAIVKRARLLTRNIRHFPMFAELKPRTDLVCRCDSGIRSRHSLAGLVLAC
ncbi:MAG: type II toxin-antitoxin system VapC family toxin [Nocardioidaceae bacterium]